MTVPDRNLARRVTELERRFAAEIRQLRMSQSLANVGHSRHIRLARTAIDPSVGSYPTSANTFWLEFLDSGFTASGGTQTPTHATRGISDGAYGHNLTGDYLDEGTVVRAMWQRGLASESDGEWWIERVVSSESDLIAFHSGFRYSYFDSSYSVGDTILSWADPTRSAPSSGLFEWNSSSHYLTHKLAGAYLAIVRCYYTGSTSNSEGDTLRLRFWKNGSTGLDVPSTDMEFVELQDGIGSISLQRSVCYHMVYNMAANDNLRLKLQSVYPGPSVPEFVADGEITILRMHSTADWNATTVPSV